MLHFLFKPKENTGNCCTNLIFFCFLSFHTWLHWLYSFNFVFCLASWILSIYEHPHLFLYKVSPPFLSSGFSSPFLSSWFKSLFFFLYMHLVGWFYLTHKFIICIYYKLYFLLRFFPSSSKKYKAKKMQNHFAQ